LICKPKAEPKINTQHGASSSAAGWRVVKRGGGLKKSWTRDGESPSLGGRGLQRIPALGSLSIRRVLHALAVAIVIVIAAVVRMLLLLLLHASLYSYALHAAWCSLCLIEHGYCQAFCAN